MTIYGRTYLRIFSAALLATFLAVAGVLAFALACSLQLRHPYLPVSAILRALPLALVATLPVSVPFAVLVAGVAYAAEVERHDGFLWMQIAGRDPRRAHLPVLAAAAGASILLFLGSRTVFPAAEYRLSREMLPIEDVAETVAFELIERPEAFGGVRAGFGDVHDGVVSDFTLASLSDAPSIAIASRTCRFEADPDGRHLVLAMSDARCARLEADGRASLDAAFDRLDVRLDLSAQGAPTKAELIDLRCYSSAELALVPEQRARLLRGGWVVSPGRERRLGALGAVPLLRLEGALLPFLFAVLVVGFGARHSAHAGRRRAFIFVAGIALLFENFTIETIVLKRSIPFPTPLIFLPSVEVGIAALVLALGARRRRTVAPPLDAPRRSAGEGR